MTEQPAVATVVEKKPVTPEEAFRRHVRKMQPRQLAGHLRRKARNAKPDLSGIFAVVLSTMYENTVPQLVDNDNRLMPLEKLKTFGRISPGLR